MIHIAMTFVRFLVSLRYLRLCCKVLSLTYKCVQMFVDEPTQILSHHFVDMELDLLDFRTGFTTLALAHIESVVTER